MRRSTRSPRSGRPPHRRPPRDHGRHPPGRTMTINIHPPEATTYKPTYAKTRRRISTSGIGMAIPLRFLRIPSGDTKALSLISPDIDSSRKATLLSTTSQTFRPTCRQQLDRLPTYCTGVIMVNKEQHRLRPTGYRVITWPLRGPNLYKNPRPHLFYLSLAYILAPTIPYCPNTVVETSNVDK